MFTPLSQTSLITYKKFKFHSVSLQLSGYHFHQYQSRDDKTEFSKTIKLLTVNETNTPHWRKNKYISD